MSKIDNSSMYTTSPVPGCFTRIAQFMAFLTMLYFIFDIVYGAFADARFNLGEVFMVVLCFILIRAIRPR